MHEKEAIWVQLIKEIYGIRSHNPFDNLTVLGGGAWLRIIGSINRLHDSGIIPRSVMQKEIGDGRSTKFWIDNWIGPMAFKDIFKRLFYLESSPNCLVADRWNEGWKWNWKRQFDGGALKRKLGELLLIINQVTISHDKDIWRWNLDGQSEFTVNEARRYIDRLTLPENFLETRWNRFIPSKVNICGWRIRLDTIPTRWNLSRKGIQVESILCRICSRVLWRQVIISLLHVG